MGKQHLKSIIIKEPDKIAARRNPFAVSVLTKTRPEKGLAELPKNI